MELRGARRKAEEAKQAADAALAKAAAEDAAAAAASARAQQAQAEEERRAAEADAAAAAALEVDAAAATAAAAAAGADTDDDDDDDPVGIDHNETACGACGAGGELLCCEGCPAAFHAPCAGYACAGDVPDAPWLCWFCALQHAPLLTPPGGGEGGRGRAEEASSGDAEEEVDEHDAPGRSSARPKHLYDDARPENGKGAGARYRRRFGPRVPLAGPFPLGRRLMLASDGACVLFYDVEVVGPVAEAAAAATTTDEAGGGTSGRGAPAPSVDPAADHLEVRTTWGRPGPAPPTEPIERIPLRSARWWHGTCDTRRCWTREEWRGLGWRPNVRLFALAAPADALLQPQEEQVEGRRGGGGGGGGGEGGSRPRIDLAAPVVRVRLPPWVGARDEDDDEGDADAAERRAKRARRQAAAAATALPPPRLSAQAEADLAIIVAGGRGGGGREEGEQRQQQRPLPPTPPPPLQGVAEGATAPSLAGPPTPTGAPSRFFSQHLLAGSAVDVRVPLRLPQEEAPTPPASAPPPLLLSGWRRAVVVRRAPGSLREEGGARLLVRSIGAASPAPFWTPAAVPTSGGDALTTRQQQRQRTLLPLVRPAAADQGPPGPLLPAGARVEVVRRRRCPCEEEEGEDETCDVDEWVPATVLHASPEGGWMLAQSDPPAEGGDGAMWRVDLCSGVRAAPTAAAAASAIVSVRACSAGGDAQARQVTCSTFTDHPLALTSFASASAAIERARAAAA